MPQPANKVLQASRSALELLRVHERAKLREIASKARVSMSSAKRAMERLRDQGAPVSYDPKTRGWQLADKSFSLPLTDPKLDDLQAAMTAAGLLDALGQSDASQRAWDLFDELGNKLHEREGRRPAIGRDALRVSQTTAFVRDPRWVLTLLRAVRHAVIEIAYRSPWKGDVATHILEPWQVGLFDGVLYVRGFSQTRGGTRTLRLAAIERLAVRSDMKPRAPIPELGKIWGAVDLRFGADVDRPGTATIRLDGAVARWVRTATWCPDQHDTLLDGEILERRLPYRSCRELARRLVAVADGVVSVEPPELRDELLRIANEAVRRLGPVPPSAGRPVTRSRWA